MLFFYFEILGLESKFYLICVRVEENSELQGASSCFDAPGKSRNVRFQLVSHGIDILSVALARLSQLRGRR